jgi:hypothetical protein
VDLAPPRRKLVIVPPCSAATDGWSIFGEVQVVLFLLVSDIVL